MDGMVEAFESIATEVKRCFRLVAPEIPQTSSPRMLEQATGIDLSFRLSRYESIAMKDVAFTFQRLNSEKMQRLYMGFVRCWGGGRNVDRL